jgi:acetate kinase
MWHEKYILTLNVGSSSLKYAIFAWNGTLDKVFEYSLPRSDDVNAIDAVLDKVNEITAGGRLVSIGHRIVHGGPKLMTPQLIDDHVMAELKRVTALAPEHLEAEIQLIEDVTKRMPSVQQVACFDTSFHRALPQVARLLPIPRQYERAGIHRYGFHGLSYEYLQAELSRLGEAAITKGRVILAHLGNGASLAALRDGQCIDTSMAFTPAAGLVMSTRAGDIDAGLIAHLVSTEAMTATQLSQFINHECGLLGVSETSGDIQQLLAIEATDTRAGEAVDLFCYQTKKWIGAFSATLGGLDALVFTGGIGEHNATIRTRICAGLDYLGLDIDAERNAKHAAIISTDKSRVTVRVIKTDEQTMIARHTAELLTQLHNIKT